MFAEQALRIEANLAKEVKTYMEQLYDVTYTGRDVQRIKRWQSR